MKPPRALRQWARRTDDAEREWARQAVDSWARTAQFSHPLKWGEAEAAVLQRDYRALPGSFVMRVVGIAGWGALALLALPIFGASVVGLALVLVASGRDPGGADLLSLARLAFGAAILSAGAMLSAWWQTRRRSVVGVVSAALTAIASVATFVMITVSDPPEMPWLSVLVLGAAILGAVGLVLELASKPEGGTKSRKPPRRGPRGAGKRLRAEKARDRLLEVLIHRRLVDLDEGDQIRVGEMPLGYWSELDGLDEREWRRVLEYRHIGWREFDPSDKTSSLGSDRT